MSGDLDPYSTPGVLGTCLGPRLGMGRVLENPEAKAPAVGGSEPSGNQAQRPVTSEQAAGQETHFPANVLCTMTSTSQELSPKKLIVERNPSSLQ